MRAGDGQDSTADLLTALRQIAGLKDLQRTGWIRSGVPRGESVADHTFGTAVLALVLGPSLGVDASRLVRLALVHDLAESDPGVGDITPYCGVDREEKRRRERDSMDRLCALLPGGDALRDLWLEYEDETSPEARLVHELDALDMALQAAEYDRRHGIDLAEFRASARLKISHPLLLRVLDALSH